MSDHGALAIALALAACLGPGCKSRGDAKTPEDSAHKPRDTAMVHEDCDLESKDAVVFDADANGRPEIIQVMKGGHEACRAVDLNGDGNIDFFSYFDDKGQQVRRESAFDRNRPQEVKLFERGVLVRKERDTNHDGKVDTWDYYAGDRVVREERDSNADAYVDEWWDFDRPERPECARVRLDADNNGLPDAEEPTDTCADEPAPPAPSAAPSASASAAPSADPAAAPGTPSAPPPPAPPATGGAETR